MGWKDGAVAFNVVPFVPIFARPLAVGVATGAMCDCSGAYFMLLLRVNGTDRSWNYQDLLLNVR